MSQEVCECCSKPVAYPWSRYCFEHSGNHPPTPSELFFEKLRMQDAAAAAKEAQDAKASAGALQRHHDGHIHRSTAAAWNNNEAALEAPLLSDQQWKALMESSFTCIID